MLESDNIVLQKYTTKDIPLLFEAVKVSVDRVYPWLPWCHPNYTIELPKLKHGLKQDLNVGLKVKSLVLVCAIAKVQ
jgi:hypothetical protein